MTPKSQRKMTRKEAIRIMKLYLKLSDAFYAAQISMGAKFTVGRLKFRKDIKEAVTFLITEL